METMMGIRLFSQRNMSTLQTVCEKLAYSFPKFSQDLYYSNNAESLPHMGRCRH